MFYLFIFFKFRSVAGKLTFKFKLKALLTLNYLENDFRTRGVSGNETFLPWKQRVNSKHEEA